MTSFVVKKENDGITVEAFLKSHCGVSSRLLAKLKRVPMGITANGKHIRSIDRLSAGDVVCICFPEEKCYIEPVEGELSVLYEDEYFLAVDKPPFMPVHPVREHRLDTLANVVMYYQKTKGESYTFRAVNRLDKDTSGIVVIAKDPRCAAILPKKITKEYTALCEGEILSGGTVDADISLMDGHTIQRQAGESGVKAVTHYEPIAIKNNHTLVCLTLETGRTHQIRTHMAYIGHPLAGDDMYGGSRAVFKRQCLHCSMAKIVHPYTGGEITVVSQPEDWLKMI